MSKYFYIKINTKEAIEIKRFIKHLEKKLNLGFKKYLTKVKNIKKVELRINIPKTVGNLNIELFITRDYNEK